MGVLRHTLINIIENVVVVVAVVSVVAAVVIFCQTHSKCQKKTEQTNIIVWRSHNSDSIDVWLQTNHVLKFIRFKFVQIVFVYGFQFTSTKLVVNHG